MRANKNRYFFINLNIFNNYDYQQRRQKVMINAIHDRQAVLFVYLWYPKQYLLPDEIPEASEGKCDSCIEFCHNY